MEATNSHQQTQCGRIVIVGKLLGAGFVMWSPAPDLEPSRPGFVYQSNTF